MRGGRLPSELWHDSVSLWRLSDGQDQQDERLEMDAATSHVDLSLVVHGSGECGLVVTWNPRPEGTSVRADYLLVTPSEAGCESPEGNWDCRGKTMLAIFVPELAFVPLANSQSKTPERPPGDNLWDRLERHLGLGQSRKWRLRPKPILVSLAPVPHAADGSEGCVLAVDFGTAASTVTLLPALDYGGISPEEMTPHPPLLKDMASWTHACFEPAI